MEDSEARSPLMCAAAGFQVRGSSQLKASARYLDSRSDPKVSGSYILPEAWEDPKRQPP